MLLKYSRTDIPGQKGNAPVVGPVVRLSQGLEPCATYRLVLKGRVQRRSEVESLPLGPRSTGPGAVGAVAAEVEWGGGRTENVIKGAE